MINKTLHSCCLDVEGAGILIEGSSGTGKTSLMLGLVERLVRAGKQAAVVSDDYTLLSMENDTLIAKSPQTIRGKVELRGFGIVDTDTISTTSVALVVRLVDGGQIERLPDATSTILHGLSLPLLLAPARHEEAASRIVVAWLHKHTDINLPFPVA